MAIAEKNNLFPPLSVMTGLVQKTIINLFMKIVN